MPMPRAVRRVAMLALLVAAGCTTTVVDDTDARLSATAPSTRLYGRWEKVEKSLPPITLELRRGATGPEGQVWLSGVTYTLAADVTDTSVVLADPASSRLAPFVGRLQKDGRLFVRLDGQPPVEAYLVRLP